MIVTVSVDEDDWDALSLRQSGAADTKESKNPMSRMLRTAPLLACVALLVLALPVACGDVSQEEYDALYEDYDALEDENDSLVKELETTRMRSESARSDSDSVSQEEYDALEAENQTLIEELETAFVAVESIWPNSGSLSIPKLRCLLKELGLEGFSGLVETAKGAPPSGELFEAAYRCGIEVTSLLPAQAPTAVPRQPAPTAVPASKGGQGNRLQAVRDRGILICAGRNDVPGFGYADSSGNNVGFDTDLCRAVAAAVLGDPNAIEIRPITAAERGPTIQSGEVDMLVRTITWTTSRDAQWGNYAQTMFYDGQGFMVRKSLGVSSALELRGATVCVTEGTTTELNLLDFSNQNNLNITPVTFEDTSAVVAAYEGGQCDAFTNVHSQLAVLGTAFADRDAHIILPETISEDPLGPVVPHGDEQWFDIVKAVMGMLIYAEAYGVNSANVPSTATGDTKLDRLLGVAGSFGQESLGLHLTAAQDVIRAVGNYGEIYERHFTPLGLVREGSRNALWLNAPCSGCPKGGQIYAPPMR